MGGEADIVRGRHHHVGDHPGLQAAHPVRQHHLRDTAEHLEALRQQLHRGVGAVRCRRTGRTATATRPAPRRTRCSPGQHPPVDHQRLTRRPHPRPAAPVMIPTPPRFRLGDQPAEVPRRPRVAGRPRRRQQPLRRDPPCVVSTFFGDQIGHRRRSCGPAPSAPATPPPASAARRSASPSCGSCRTSRRHPETCPPLVGGNHVHPFPRSLQWRSPPRSSVTG